MAETEKYPHRVVVALGGNALGNYPSEEMERIDAAVPSLVELLKLGNEVILTHGNGPQVGMIQKAFQIGHDADPFIPPVGLPDAGALSEGYIGYHLQQGMQNEIIRQGLNLNVATIITTIEVDGTDPSFSNPVKPIGEFLTEEEVEIAHQMDPSVQFMEDSGRGFRRVVSSPMPLKIVEAPSILNLVDNEFVVIACGGGGIPVVRLPDGTHRGIPCVLDKDLASAMLAEDTDADVLFLLTAVEHVALNFGAPDQVDLTDLTTEDAKNYLAEGEFGKGSMEPKVEAAVRFAESKPGRVAIIGALSKAPECMRGESGTRIHV